MLHKSTTTAAIIMLAAALLAPASPGYAQPSAQRFATRHTGPIWQWRNHQPRQDQLKALHKKDLTSEEAIVVDRLYRQLQAPNWPSGQTVTLNCPRHHLECRVSGLPQ
jgi:hypothetical protein